VASSAVVWWAARVRVIVGEPAAGIALATAVFQIAQRVEIGAASAAAAVVSMAAALGPAATGDRRALAAREAAVAAAEAAAVAGDKFANGRQQMKPVSGFEERLRQFWIWCGVAGALLMVLAVSASAQAPASAKTASAPASATAAGAETFATPQEAADALVEAAKDFDAPRIKKIFGPEGADVVLTGEQGQDRELAAAFSAEAAEKKRVSMDPKSGNRAFLVVGQEDWPFPAPIVKRNNRWVFDAKAGRQEILYRRVGRNELDAIQICHGYVEAQNEYALEKREGYNVNQYAQRIISIPGKQDGLAWRNPDGTYGGPIGEKIAEAIEQGYKNKAEPYHGYFFKVLKGQGPAAPLGRLDYVINGVMIGGFALVAAPAEYGVTGVKTFMVSQDGVVYEKDLGPDTLTAFKQMELFNPDNSWDPVEDEQ
jgi:hypothetical protein